jgi:ubiquinone biosynthesis protein UbiJ
MFGFLPVERLEAAVDRAVHESGRARELCAQLNGRRLRVVATGSPWTVDLHVANGTVRLRAGGDSGLARRSGHDPQPDSADATLRGSAVALLGALGESQRAWLQNGSLRIDGDAEIAQRFAELLRCLRPDVENEIARLTGPIPAHLLTTLSGALWRNGRALWESQSRSVADYLAHERRTLVSAPEAEHHYRGIEAARERLDRLDARLQQLENRR